MAHIEKKQGKALIILNEKETVELGLEKGEFDFFQPKKGLLVLTEKTVSVPENSQPVEKKTIPVSENNQPKLSRQENIDEKIFGLLSDRQFLSNRVVGRFEKMLGKEEQERLEELLKQGIVEKFKLNESYKNPIYQLTKKRPAEVNTGAQPSSFSVPKKEPFRSKSFQPKSAMASSLDKEGFAILNSDGDARRISSEKFEEFKKGSLRGIKNFDGSFFVIQKKLLDTIQPKIMAFLEKEKKASLQEISNSTMVSQEKARIACEFLKEDGQVFEKTKNNYCLV